VENSFEINKDKFFELINTTTKVIQQQQTGQDLAEKLNKVLTEHTSITPDDARQVINDIFNIIDLVDQNAQSIQNARNEGVSRTQWLRQQLDHTISKYNIESPELLITEIKEGLRNANLKICGDIFEKEIDLSEPLISPRYDDLNKTAIVKNFQEEIKNNTLLGALTFEDGTIVIDKDHKEIQAIKEYFEAGLDSGNDKAFKKAISIAILIGREKGILPDKILQKSPEEIGIIADRGITATKVAYKVGRGELSPLDAMEYTIDHNVAVLNSSITNACVKYGSTLGGKVGGTIGSVFGPAGTRIGTAIGRVVGEAGGHVVGQYICEGVKKVVSVAKSVAKKGWEGIKSCVRDKCSKLYNWLKS